MNNSINVLGAELAMLDMDRGRLEEAIRNSSSEERETFVDRLGEQGLNLHEGILENGRMIQVFNILIEDLNKEFDRLTQKTNLQQKQIFVLENRRDQASDLVDSKQEMITALQNDNIRLRSQMDQTSLELLHCIQKLEALQQRSDRIQFLMALRNRIQIDKNPSVDDLVLGIRERCSQDAQVALKNIKILKDSVCITINWIFYRVFETDKSKI